MSEPDVDAIAARAREEAAVFLRQEWRESRRRGMFLGSVWLAGALAVAVALPSFGLGALASVGLVGGLVAIGAATMIHHVRCPRCDRLPWSQGVIMSGQNPLDIKGCAKCGLDLAKREE